MAKLLQAVRDYGPKLKKNDTAQLETSAEWMSMRTGLNTSEIVMVYQETTDMLLYFLRRGTPVKLPGIGTFTPSINRHGEIKVNLRLDSSLRKKLNGGDEYIGTITHKDQIGLDDAGYKALWDADHPDDLLEI